MQTILYESISLLAQGLPVKQIQKLGRALGRLMWRVLPKRREMAIQAITLHLKTTRSQAMDLARESFQQSGCSFLELFLNRKFDFRFMPAHVRINDPANFLNLFETQRPIVATSGHFGAWELLAGLFNLYTRARPTQIIAYYPKNPAFSQMLIHNRQHAAMEVVSNRKTTIKISRCLRQNGICGFLVDQNCVRRKALFLPFLEKIAAVNMGPASLAVLNKALVWPIFLKRDPDGRYTLFSQQPLDTTALEGTKQEKIKETALFYTQAVQEMLLSAPEQWLWMHERWKTRPKDASDIESSPRHRKRKQVPRS